MRKKKLQVFVSSTYTDLISERQAAVEAILNAGHIPAGMELFSAGDETQLNVIKNWIDESDVYMLILGGRYGSIELNSGKSYTHIEYEYAVEKGKPYFAVVISDKALDEKIKNEGKAVLEQEEPKKLKEFKNTVLSKIVRQWDDKKDIKLAILETLNDFEKREEIKGWVKAEDINMAGVAEEIARLAKENDELRKKVNEQKSDNAIRINGLPIEIVIENMRNFKCEKQKIFSLFYFDQIEGNVLHEKLAEYNSEYLNLLQLFHILENNILNYTNCHHEISDKLEQLRLIRRNGLTNFCTDEGEKLRIYIENNPHLLKE